MTGGCAALKRVFALALAPVLAASACKSAPKPVPDEPSRDEEVQTGPNPPIREGGGGGDPWSYNDPFWVREKQASAGAADLCKAQPEGYALWNPGDCVFRPDDESYRAGSVTYGDFDGDGRTDSVATLRHVKSGELAIHVWFGGEKASRDLFSFRYCFRPEGRPVLLDEKTVDRQFQRCKGKKVDWKLGKEFLVPFIHFASKPDDRLELDGPDGRSESLNVYDLKRSILFQARGETMDFSIMVFDRKREKIHSFHPDLM